MSASGSSLLSPVQRRIVAAGGTALAAVILLATAFFFFDLLRRFVGSFQDVLLPLAIAAILATLLRPIITFLETRTRLGRTTGIILLFLLVILLLGVVAVFIVPALFDQITAFIKEVPTIVQNVLTFSQE
ncbi:MAG: AI-2E family transporter, partial [Verrucomicrobiota bacterium]